MHRVLTTASRTWRMAAPSPGCLVVSRAEKYRELSLQDTLMPVKHLRKEGEDSWEIQEVHASPNTKYGKYTRMKL